MTPRLPRRRYLVDRWVTVALVSAEAMRDVVGDHEPAEGAWDADTLTISILASLSPARRQRVLGHEMIHALIDLLDRR